MRAQAAGRALAATVAPGVQLAAFAKIAGVALGAYEIHKRLAALRFGQPPGVGLVKPHQGSVDDETRVHADVERHLHGFHRVVPAVRVAGRIRFAHADDNVPDALFPRQRRGRREKKQVAPRHKGVRQALIIHGDRHVAGHGRVTDLREEIQFEQGVASEARPPRRVDPGSAFAQAPAAFQFHGVPLSVGETDGFHPDKMVQRPAEASR